ncbi:MAG TPA: GNAT family N-acetyltransferase [Clostridia bacterium]|nr:GNAT family N-acetyltransferase [Clostridia bacterium]
MRENITGRQTLNKSELEAIRELADFCDKHDGIRLKLNWDMLISRQPGNTDDFLCFDETGRLDGYLAIYCFGMPEAEISGMVRPSCRRNGIFSKLLAQAVDECRRRSVKSILFINSRNSDSAIAFAKAKGTTYDHSEHRMELPGSMNPITVKYPIRLRKADASDIDMLTRLNALCFDVSEDESRSHMLEIISEMGKGTDPAEVYISVFDDSDIGMLRLNWENDELMIYGFGLLPEYRGKGLGRATLGTAVNLSLTRKPSHVGLEVDCFNDTALSLYKSCGFSTIATYDYYRLAI